MADFKKALDVVLKHEGGFVDDPDDPGGATNYGITFKTFYKYAPSLDLHSTVEALKNIQPEDVEFIYRYEYWNKMLGDDITDQEVATLIFDSFVNMGYNGIKIAQREAGVNADGQIGNNSLASINAAAPRVLFDQIKEARIDFYHRLIKRKPKLAKFRRGWMNRINSFVYKNGEAQGSSTPGPLA